MKKWIALTLALLLSLSLTACGGQSGAATPDAGPSEEQAAEATNESTVDPADEQTADAPADADEPTDNAPADADATLPEEPIGPAAPDETTQIANPFVDYASYEEAEAAAGFAFGVPEEIGNYKKAVYRVAENMSLFEVIYENDAASLTARKAPGGWNISGDNNQYTVEVAETLEGVNVTCWGEGDALFLGMWTVDEYSYSLGATESMERADFLGAVETIIALNAA